LVFFSPFLYFFWHTLSVIHVVKADIYFCLRSPPVFLFCSLFGSLLLLVICKAIFWFA
jgi:hypothetical protein